MNSPDLSILEREVEQARAKFAADLARVRSPTTVANFKDDLRMQALETKNDLVAKTTQAARDTTQRVLQDIKDRALANPVAALAIGAGVAWRLARHPPIASALIGFGIVSLLRTSPHSEKVHEAAARRLSDASSRAREVAESARQKVEHWADDARERVRESAQGISERASTATERAGAIAEEAGKATQETVSQLSERASELAQRASAVVRDVASDPDTRDKLLLGAATLAVTAAVGIAYQRRMQERHQEAA
jgi:hypothetical protein